MIGKTTEVGTASQIWDMISLCTKFMARDGDTDRSILAKMWKTVLGDACRPGYFLQEERSQGYQRLHHKTKPVQAEECHHHHEVCALRYLFLV